jgi:hypothetical protein
MSLTDKWKEAIAKALIQAGEEAGKEVIKELKKAGLRSAGSGLPDSVIEPLLEDLRDAIGGLTFGDGEATWGSGSDAVNARFVSLETLVSRMARGKVRWVGKARLTQAGARLVEILGEEQFTTAVEKTLPALVTRYISVAGDAIHEHPTNKRNGVVLVTRVISTGVAAAGTARFKPHELIFFVSGEKKQARKSYRGIKSTVTTFTRKKLKQPTAGPFFNPR